MNEPMGLLGSWKAGSSLSTSVCVTMVAACLSMPRSLNSFRSERWNMYPIAPCVSAPQ